MRYKLLIISLLAACLVNCKSTTESNNDVREVSLPEAPVGYVWYEAKNGAGTFLQPHGWHLKEEVKEGVSALFISKENIETTGRYLTGLSINKIESFSKTQNSQPNSYAKQFVSEIKQSGEVIKQTVVKGNFPDMNIVRVNLNEKNAIVHYISIGDDKKDIFYLISFEAPEQDWSTEFETAKPMLNFFIL